MGFNGTEYTKNDTPAILRIYPILNTPPILRTLESAYHTTQGPDTVLIANYPIPQWRTDVTVTADNNRVIPINPARSFIIDPSTYSVGAHTVKVLFKHKLDSISITRSFTISSPFAPMMMANRKFDVPGEGGPLNVSPNPFNQQIMITGLDANKNYTLRLYDAQGRAVLTDRSFNQNRKALQLNGNSLTKGVYFLEIYDDSSKEFIKTIKLLKL
jgi:hypothetical protein